jgi:hypothetical protein
MRVAHWWHCQRWHGHLLALALATLVVSRQQWHVAAQSCSSDAECQYPGCREEGGVEYPAVCVSLNANPADLDLIGGLCWHGVDDGRGGFHQCEAPPSSWSATEPESTATEEAAAGPLPLPPPPLPDAKPSAATVEQLGLVPSLLLMLTAGLTCCDAML